MVEPYWPPALSEPNAAAVAASISGLSSFMIWKGSSEAKAKHSHLVNEIVSLVAGGLTDGLVDGGAGLLRHASALLFILGGALLVRTCLILVFHIVTLTCSCTVVHAWRGAALQTFSTTCSQTSSVLGFGFELDFHLGFFGILTWCHRPFHTGVR